MNRKQKGAELNMAQTKEDYYFDGTHWRARFHEFQTEKSTLYRICTADEANYKVVNGERTERSQKNVRNSSKKRKRKKIRTL